MLWLDWSFHGAFLIPNELAIEFPIWTVLKDSMLRFTFFTFIIADENTRNPLTFLIFTFALASPDGWQVLPCLWPRNAEIRDTLSLMYIQDHVYMQWKPSKNYKPWFHSEVPWDDTPEGGEARGTIKPHTVACNMSKALWFHKYLILRHLWSRYNSCELQNHFMPSAIGFVTLVICKPSKALCEKSSLRSFQ